MVRETPRRRNGGRNGSKIGLFGILGRVVAILALVWLGGFLWFSLTLPEPAALAQKTDAVVVLTGGAGRTARGLEVLKAGGAERMLVSGVGRSTTRKQLAAAAGMPKSRFATTDLGYEAVDTRSNAEETMRWVRANNFTSIRLVTSAGHMRRARLELARVLPASVTVLPDAVPTQPQAPSIAAEYSKFLLRRIALALGAI
ncbi:hypothetical protein GCM10011529_20540 [Polymorphobacter glacialis]|uniref:DUF218 domain-containing protein n=1 Tax=Sandarakinorhabdus glacialis TaxID=1614636 RepID=A0A916ZUZ1_9SPHN|nr:YdcF family protein [Polymorphobacter glacialis]GGE14008.1 hypothetical protein GCM10011529_20540 [Polymorphobacter glacialis]